MDKKLEKTIQYYKTILVLAAMSLPLGAIVGCLATLFGKILLLVSGFRNEHLFIFVPLLGAAGWLIVFCYKRFGGKAQQGMGLVFSVADGKEDVIPIRLIPLVTVSTWITHLFGGSAGREGVAVQIGATVFNTVEKKLPMKYQQNILLIAGVAAGFSGLFQTPLAATLFAMEVFVVGRIQISALIPALAASYAASTTSHALGLEKFSFHLPQTIVLNASMVWKLIIVGILFGVVGGLFAYGLRLTKKWLSRKFPSPYIRIGVIGLILSALLLTIHVGRYCGLGTNLIDASFHQGIIYRYDWILKAFFTILTLSAGFQGGEVTPLFAIGASLGVCLANVFGLPVLLIAALGYTAVFASATNTFFAPIFIGAEVFGFQYIVWFFIVCAISYFCNGNQSIYNQK